MNGEVAMTTKLRPRRGALRPGLQILPSAGPEKIPGLAPHFEPVRAEQRLKIQRKDETSANQKASGIK